MKLEPRIPTVGRVLSTTLGLVSTLGPLVVALLRSGNQEPGQKKNRPNRPDKETNNKSGQPQPLALNVPQSLLDEYRANQEQRDAAEKERARIDCKRLRVEIAAFIVLAFGTGSAIGTLIFLNKSTRAARDAAESARHANELSATASRIDQRAWVYINSRTYQIIPDKPGMFQVVLGLNNTGKTPARALAPRVIVRLAPFPRPNWPTITPSTPFALFPSASGYSASSDPQPRPID